MKKKDELFFEGECPNCPYTIKRKIDGTIIQEYICKNESRKLKNANDIHICPLDNYKNEEKINIENENSTN